MKKCYIFSVGNPFFKQGDTLCGYTSSRKKAKRLCRQLNSYREDLHYYREKRQLSKDFDKVTTCLDHFVFPNNMLCGDCRHYFYDEVKQYGFCRKKKDDRWWVQPICSKFKAKKRTVQK